MVVEVVPMLRGKIQLPLYLREDDRNISDHQKRERYWGTTRARKKYSYPQYDSFIGIWGGIEVLLEMLLA